MTDKKKTHDKSKLAKLGLLITAILVGFIPNGSKRCSRYL